MAKYASQQHLLGFANAVNEPVLIVDLCGDLWHNQRQSVEKSRDGNEYIKLGFQRTWAWWEPGETG